MPRSCFWDSYWERAVQLLVIFSVSLVTSPEVFAQVYSTQFSCRFQIVECSDRIVFHPFFCFLIFSLSLVTFRISPSPNL